MDVGESKKRLRSEMLRRLTQIRPAQRALEEELVTGAIQGTPEWKAAGLVLLYRDLPGEFSTVGLANAAWRLDKRVAMPRVAGPGQLALHEVRAWTDLRPGAFGIQEPQATLPVVEPAAVDLAIVPAVAWTREGRRLGRGGGYYDRLVPRLRLAWGIGFDLQVMAALPLEAHDAKVHRLLTAASLG
ncbi:MAG TPA: 5-formyltetrahydrofolate cyclo-ligase [Candidatus Thermoplasmatota archaeon]|nr:5-formyltetrahydrofolate cyclo-ligase [Candidatus Thermoplasmatota archaeon]